MDGSGPPRANAAQLAQRNIKASRGRRPAGHRATPVQSPSGAQFGQSQGTTGAQFGGGLFGGSIQPPAGGQTFSFSVAGGPSIPDFNNPFTMGARGQSPAVSENDERRDPAEERPNKRRSGASGSDEPLFAPIASNPFAQAQSSNLFGSANGQQATGLFSFGGASPLSQPGVNFNSTPAANPFGSSNTPFQPQAPTPPPINFGGVSQEKPASNLFNFGQPPAQAGTGSTGFKFGASTTPAKPTNSPFLFGQTSGQSASTAINFGSTPAINTSASNLFGTSQPPSTNLFGSAAQQPAPGLFANLNSPTVSSSNLFGSRESSPAPSVNTNNLFGKQEQNAKPPVSNGLLGLQTQEPTPIKPTSNLFGITGQTSTGSNLFSQQNQQTAPNTASSTLFGSASQPINASAPFGEQKSLPTTTMFGNLNQSSSAPSGSNMFSKPVEQSGADGSLFGRISKPPTPSNDLFGNLNKPVDPAVTNPKPNTASLFSMSGTQNQSPTLFNQQASSSSLFSRTTSAPTPSAPQAEVANPSQSSSPFGSAEFKPASSSEPSKTNVFSSMKPMEAPKSANDPPPAGMFPSLQQPTAQQASNSDSSQTFKSVQGESINAVNQLPEPAMGKRHDGKSLREIGIAKQITEEFMDPLVPAHFNEHERKDFYAAYRIRALNDAMALYFSGLKSSADPTSALKFYIQQRTGIMDDVNVRNAKKRSTTHEPGLDEGSPSKRAKQGDISTVQNPSFNPSAPSPEKEQFGADPKPYTNGNTAPQSTAFPPAPTLTPVQQNSSSSSPAGKRKANDDLSSQNVEDASKRPLRQIKTPKLNGSNDVSNDGLGGGSNTSNIFKNILDSPPKSPQKSPTKKTASGPSVSNDAPSKPNPFSSLPVPKSPTKSATPAPFSFGVKPTQFSSLTPPSLGLFESKKDEPSNPVASEAPFSNVFGTKPSDAAKFGVPTTSSSGLSRSKPAGFSMPGFNTGPMNFAAQFGQQAEKDKKDSEQKLMERDMDNDLDSDDDKDVWIENWKEKRRSELEKLDALTKTGKGFSFGQPPSKAKEPEVSPPSKPLFGLALPAQSQSSGLFSPVNISRTPTPGAISSASGSVLDGHAPGRPVNFGNNIFGHLSDSPKSNDADDESAEDSDPEADGDSENKDPDYTPDQETGSGSGTPVDETGAGIASVKKANLFNFTPSKTGSIFGQSASGTATPTSRGGLFDRITRDSNGNPVRAISTEEKENTQPSPTNVVADVKNPFSALNKSQTIPTDQTWKIDSPIKFGSATPTSDTKNTTPTFSVTAATPTKSGSPAGLFANLNSSSGPTSAPFSNLFGNSGIIKPAASAGPGFSFGGASNTSSLFNSVTTSRATSPGATTDGDSAAEDPDVEKHEQINLTAGGPGEEDEEVVLEVRAKAMQFVQKEGDDSAWETKGLGPLRILKHKETNAARILLRADPRGTVVLNKGILNFKYEAVKKTVKLMTAGESGKGLETWLLQVKTEDIAQQLAEALEASKSI